MAYVKLSLKSFLKKGNMVISVDIKMCNFTVIPLKLFFKPRDAEDTG